MSERYNVRKPCGCGWANYETWVWKLWIDNEEGWYNAVVERAREIVEDIDEGDGFLDVDQTRLLRMKEYLENEADEMLGELDLSGPLADILNAGVGSIEWYEIAEAYLEDLE